MIHVFVRNAEGGLDAIGVVQGHDHVRAMLMQMGMEDSSDYVSFCDATDTIRTDKSMVERSLTMADCQAMEEAITRKILQL